MGNILNLYTDENSPAFQYAAKVFFENIAGYKLNIQPIKESNNAVHGIVYGKKTQNRLPLIQQKSITETETDFVPKNNVEFGGYIFPFKTGNESILPYDPIALTYLLITSPQEQLKLGSYDKHNRFIDDNSWLKQNKMLQFPLLDIAANQFTKAISHSDYVFKPENKNYIFTPTFDIDIAFAHSAKRFFQHILGTASLIKNVNIKQLNERFSVWFNKKPDPYDNFDIILEELEKKSVKACFFAMTANRGKFDNNNYYKSKLYKNLLKKISEKHTVGIHPSYKSFEKKSLLISEKKRLEDIIGKKVIHSRQHFLRQQLPHSWHALIEAGIEHDYTTGYANEIGYKSGTCKPYPAFDIVLKKELPLTIHSFALMDTAQYDYLNLNEEEIINNTKLYSEVAKSLKTNFSAVWHNYAMPLNSNNLEIFKKQISLLSSND